jgi:hypothetical protein
MRVLLAIDGSISSNRARDLVAGLPWPEGSVIRIVGVLERGPELFGLPWIPVIPENAAAIEADLVTQTTNALETAGREIGRPGLKVDQVLLRDHAARAIVDQAREFGAELVVVGSRGHSTMETLLLGSTSAEVVDHAPCPVLVAREPQIGSIILAEDGSTGAQGAAACIESWPILAGIPVTVVSVAEIAIPWAGAAPGIYEQMMESYTESVEEARREYHEIARRRAETLAQGGRPVQLEVREGDAAAEIVAAAAEGKTDLIVIGTRGHTGLTRMLLGSIARKVLVHAPCSVLVVREGVAAGHKDAATAETSISGG